MTRPVTVGLDGSAAGFAAAEWGAREARRRELPLRLVHAWEWQPYAHAPPVGADGPRLWSERVARAAAAELRGRHPELTITGDHLTGAPSEVLCDVARDAELLAVGTAGIGGLAGFFVGTVAMSVVAHTERAVVLVRAGTTTEDEHRPAPDDRPASTMPCRPVALGLDLSRPCDEVIRFAFDAAAVRAAPLQVIHGWSPPAFFAHGGGAERNRQGEMAAQEAEEMRTALLPWRERYPGVEVLEQSLIGNSAQHLVEAGATAGLVVIGRHSTRSWAGAPHIGHTAHGVLHHCPAPVAVVPHA